MDNRLLFQLQQIFSRLHTPISLLDADGNSLIPNEDIRFTLPPLTQPGIPVAQDGRLYQICTSSPSWVIMTTITDADAARDAFVLCDAMIGAAITANEAGNDLNNAYQRILQNELSLAELDAVVDEHGISPTMPRCVLLMHMVQVQLLERAVLPAAGASPPPFSRTSSSSAGSASTGGSTRRLTSACHAVAWSSSDAS